jgi:hypothetical protein
MYTSFICVCLRCKASEEKTATADANMAVVEQRNIRGQKGNDSFKGSNIDSHFHIQI